MLTAPGLFRMIPIGANGQPALALYKRDARRSAPRARDQVLTVTERGISHLVAFQNPDLFGKFGLPATVEQARL